jgi:hypothetical protein
MSDFLAEMAKAEARSWPDDQRYQCRCSHCGGLFFGPKRALLCWPHWEERGAALEARKQAMIAEYGPFIERHDWFVR